MAGGGGDAPPPPPINGGEFLLQLLKNPPQHPRPLSQPLPHDPAVAAVGPSIPFPTPTPPLPFSSPSPSRPLLFPPHNNNNNYFNQGLGLGFPQNPNPNPNWTQEQGVLGYLSKLGLIHSNHQQQQQQQQEPDRHSKLVFGSLHSDFQTPKNANMDYDLATVEKHLFKERELAMGMGMGNNSIPELSFGNYVSTSQPPPGFGFAGRRMSTSEQPSMTMDKGKANHSHRDAANYSGEIGGKHSVNDRGARGTHLHSVDEKTNSMVLELDDLEEQVDNLLLEDDNTDVRKGPKSRDKDYRSDKRGQWLLNQRMRNHRSHIECRRDINTLNSHFLEIYHSLIPPQEEKDKQKQLMALLNKHVTNEWPTARLFLYGSCANSFGFRKSDIDVCLAMGDDDVDKSEILLKLADILKSDNLENVQALTRARVPIVKLMDPATGISCDICVNNLLAVINTKLLRDYSKIDVRLRQLAFIVKHWAKSRGVNETYQGTLSSYAYVLMCIHFLQQRSPSILPCLQGMEITYKVNVDDVECSYFDQVEKLQGFGSRNGESIAQLVWAFFNYWAYRHDYTNDVISIRMGCLISKREKDWTRRIGNDRHLICIEDPFEVSHDLGRVVDKRSIRVLREEFERAAEVLQYDPNPCVKLFEPYVPS